MFIGMPTQVAASIATQSISTETRSADNKVPASAEGELPVAASFAMLPF